MLGSFMRLQHALLFIALGAAVAAVQAQPRVQITKDQLKAEYAGICRNPDAAFPKSVPEDKKAAVASWCSCVQEAIDQIPDSRLPQAVEETVQEYAQYKA